MFDRIKLTQSQMNVMLLAVEHGYRQCEKGHNLQAALASVFELYEVMKPAEEMKLTA
jgi:hypothetical protein